MSSNSLWLVVTMQLVRSMHVGGSPKTLILGKEDLERMGRKIKKGWGGGLRRDGEEN